jgi:hypothetical protein
MVHHSVRLIAGAVVVSVVLSFSSIRATDEVNPAVKATVVNNLSAMPLSFTQNNGQWPDSILFRADANGAIMWFTKNGIWYQFFRKVEKSGATATERVSTPLNASSTPRTGLTYDPWAADILSAPFQDGQVGYLPRTTKGGPDRADDSIETTMIKAEFVGASESVEVVGLEVQEYKCNYFIGNDQTKWRTDVPNYSAVTMRGLYQGVDVTFSAKDGMLREQINALSSDDLAQVKVEYFVGGRPPGLPQAGKTGTRGRVPRTTTLSTYDPWAADVPSAPFQDGQVGYLPRTNISGVGVPSPDTLFFEDGQVGAPDRTENVPRTTVQTSLGEHHFEGALLADGLWAADILSAPFQDGQVGYLPRTEPVSERQILSTTSNPSGVALVYSTYLGGSSDDMGYGIAVDGAGSAYVTGRTNSSNFPTVNPFDGSWNGGLYDAFVTKLSAAGNSLVYSTYLGGNGYDYGAGIAVDGSGSAYVSGATYSADFPTATPFDGSLNGGWDVFVTKLNPAGNSLDYSNYLGGNDHDYGAGIAVDGAGSAYVTGSTNSFNFPTLGPFDGTFNGNIDVFVTKVSPAGNSLVYSTYMGGSSLDYGDGGITVDWAGSAYVMGSTASADFPTTTPFDGSFNGGQYDAFVTKLSPGGNSLAYSTYLGGSSDDVGYGIEVDGVGSAYVTGNTYSTDFPTAAPYDASLNGPNDAFVTKLSPAGNSLVYSTYLGGTNYDYGYGIAVDLAGSVYVTGVTISSDFPTATPFDGSLNGGYYDAFVTKLSAAGNSLVYSTYLGGNGYDHGAGIAVDGAGSAYVTGETYSADFPAVNPFDGSYNGVADAFVTKLSPVGNPSVLLFNDYFWGNPSVEWTPTIPNCTWQVSNNSWRTSASGQQVYCIQSAGNSSWRNYDYQVDVMGNAGVDKVVNFRLQDANNWYGLNLRSGSGPGGVGELLLTKRVNGGLPNLLSSVSFANSNGQWYRLKVSCVDENLTVSVNGVSAITYTDTSDVYYSGGIGVTCYTGGFGTNDISFDNVLVTDPYPHIVLDTIVTRKFVGDQITITGRLKTGDGGVYTPTSGMLSVEDPAKNLVTTTPILPDGSFTYSASSAGAEEGVYMYVFACSTSAGVVKEMYSLPLFSPGTLKLLPVVTDFLIPLVRKYDMPVGPTRQALTTSAETLIRRVSSTQVKIQNSKISKGLGSLYGAAKTAVATAHRKAFPTGNFFTELRKVYIEDCTNLNVVGCAKAQGQLALSTIDLPWNSTVALLDNGVDKLYEKGLIDNCTYQGAKAGIASGDLVVSMIGLGKGKPKSVLDAMVNGIPIGEVKTIIVKRFENCNRPTLSATYEMPGFDGVLMSVDPKMSKAFTATTYSPVDIKVIDPLGREVSRDTIEVPGAEFIEIDMDMDDDLEQLIIVPMDSTLGECQVFVTAKSGALPTDTFSVVANYTYYQTPDTIANNLLISQVPSAPISIPTFENLAPPASSPITPDESMFNGYPTHLTWTSTLDPNPGHIVSYDVIVAKLADFSDSVVLSAGTLTSFDFHSWMKARTAGYDTSRFYWKVLAHDDWGAGTSSSPRSFFVEYCCKGTTGNVDCDPADGTDISDLSALIDNLYISFIPLCCPAEANVDGQTGIDISDLSALIDYLYISFTPPAACQ